MTRIALEKCVEGHVATRDVFIDDEPLDPAPSLKARNHSPDGFSWGYGGSGPSQLALAILMRFVSKEEALDHYQQFKADKIAALDIDKDFVMPFSEIRSWIADNIKKTS